VTSGKGGVGKTSIAVNLAVSLRLFGADILLVDADMGLGNVDVLLGLDTELNLCDVALRGKAIEHVVVEGPRGLRILPGASGVQELAELDDTRVADFLERINRYCAAMDFVIVDTSPGITSPVVNCLMAADEVLLVTNPEPTAITDAYALLKVMSKRPGARERTVSIIMNQTVAKEEALRSFDRLRAATRLFIEWDIEYLGSVARDDAVSAATRRQVDFVTYYSASPCARDVRKIAARLASVGQQTTTEVGRFFRTVVEETRDE
jgi:flagellar biosynthesis protein FlhG